MMLNAIAAISLACLVSVAAQAWAAEERPSVSDLCLMTMDTGVRFGVWGKNPRLPAPTLFVFAGTIEQSLGHAYYRQCGNDLAEQGFLCVSMDLPGHGADCRPGEPKGISCWRHRAERSEDFVAELNAKLSQVLDHLVGKGYSDPGKVAACGTSRGGYVALRFAASEPRVRCAAAFAPVVDFRAVSEFRGVEPALLAPFALTSHVDKLAAKAVWIVIGDRDARVDTDSAIAFARALSKASVEKDLKGTVELHVLPEPAGHTTPRGSSERAALWIREQLR